MPFIKNVLTPLALAGVLCAPLAAAEPSVPRVPSAEDAPIALMVDMTSGQVLYAREAERRFMPASITKVMTTFLAFEMMDEGRLLPQQWFDVPDRVYTRWHGVGSTMFLPARARVTVDQLLHGITTVSANDGAAALAEGATGSIDAWTAAMNAKAREIGMRDSYFGTANGWMDEGRTFVTARDLVTLGSAMVRRHPDKYHAYVGRHAFTFNGITQVNHDPISGKIAGADGIKTGFTNQAGYGFLGSAERNGRRLMMVVAASPTGARRNAAAREFIEWGFAAFDSRILFRSGSVVAQAEVQNGSAALMPLRASQAIGIAYPRGTRPAVTMEVRYKGPLRAPIRAGDEVAQLTIHVAGMPDAQVPLVADTAIARAGAARRIWNGLAGIFS